MAIDTAAKRKSVINNGLPGMALLPIPDGAIAAIDRRRLADFYSLGSQVIARNFWVPDKREATIEWGGDARSSQNWVQDRRSESDFEQDKRVSTTWKQDEEPNTDWVEDTEVPTE